jgi:hypothetical protein
MPTPESSDRLSGWLIGLVFVIFSVATYWAISDPADAVKATKPADAPTRHYLPDEVRRLLSFVDSARADTLGSRGHEFAASGVRYVAAALRTVASASGLSIDGELEVVREQATAIQRDPRPRVRASQARLAFANLAVLLEGVQQARFQGLEPDVASVGRAAASLRTDRSLRDQAEVVEEFFNRAASAIRAMNDAVSSPRARRVVETA